MTYSLLCVLCGEFRHTLYVDECFDDLADSISELTERKFNSALEKAMECERLLNKKDRRFYLFSEQVAEMYKSAKSECKSEKLMEFCDTRAKLVINTAKIWVKDNA